MSRYKPCGAENCQLTKDKERIAELEAELKYLRLEAKEDEELIDKLEVEVERQKEIVFRQTKLNTEVIRERDRYREALQTIADECEIEFQYAADVANDALKEQT